MKSFYTLKLARPREKELFSTGGPAYRQVNLPNGCPQLNSAQEINFSRLENGILVQQQLSNDPLYVELFWLDAAQPVAINYEILEPVTILFYMLQGQIKIQAASGVEPDMEIKERLHYMVQYRPGSYTAFYPSGQHLCFFIVLPESWIVQHHEDFPLLEKLVMSLKNHHLARHQVPQIYINRDLYRWLDKQRKLQPPNPAILEVFIWQFLAHLLHGYENALARQHALAFKALEYIQEQYTLQDFTHLWLTSQLYTNKKTLFQRFKAAFNCTPTAFANGLRMKLAHRLLTEEKLPVKEVYFIVGYSSRSAFRSAYKIYLENLNK